MPCKMDSGAMYEGVPISWQMDQIRSDASDRSISRVLSGVIEATRQRETKFDENGISEGRIA